MSGIKGVLFKTYLYGVVGGVKVIVLQRSGSNCQL